ncbi:MAG: hypothetical protein Q7R48_00455 [bacterium]|nr:hypothetical protein [bacterium]
MQYTALEQTFSALKDVDPRNAAEHAYALAMLYKQAGDNEEAIRFGREAILLFDKCHMETLEECAALNQTIEGVALPDLIRQRVALPDLIHQDVVRGRLQPLML